MGGYIVCKGGRRNAYKILENLKIDLDIDGGYGLHSSLLKEGLRGKVLGMFTELQKATFGFVMSVRPPVRVEQLCSH